VILVKKLVDPDNGYRYYVFYEQGQITRPIMLLDHEEFQRIEEAFQKEVYDRG
jgi:hypothetical protein